MLLSFCLSYNTLSKALLSKYNITLEYARFHYGLWAFGLVVMSSKFSQLVFVSMALIGAAVYHYAKFLGNTLHYFMMTNSSVDFPQIIYYSYRIFSTLTH